MGARIEVEVESEAGRRAGGADPGSRIASWSATEVGGEEVPLAIDELPLVALAACFAEGETVIRDAAELRRKESDRIATVVDGADGARRRRRGDRRRLDRQRAAADCAGAARRRTAITASRCWARSPGSPRATESRCDGVEAAEVSYPGFERDLASLAR